MVEAAHWGLFIAAIFLTLSAGAGSSLNVSDVCTTSDGFQGVCRLVVDCPWVIAQLRNRTLHNPVICGYLRRSSIVCCKVDTDFDPEWPLGVKRISQLKCEEYKEKYEEELDEPVVQSNKSTNVVRECPLFASSLTVGGEHATTDGNVPFVVGIGFTSGNLSDIKWSCGGALIGGSHVLTAAHCSFSHLTGSSPAVVRVGSRQLGTSVGKEKPLDIFYVSKVMVHPNYTGSNNYHDIAVLKLETEVRFTDKIRPACIWRHVNETRAVALGWGLIGEKRSEYLEKSFLSLMDSKTCKTKVSSSSKIPDGITEELVCAGDTSRYRTEPCKVDVGGPLVVPSPSSDCMFHLLGIMSFVPSCNLSSPAVFTRVAPYLPWIESVVWSDN